MTSRHSLALLFSAAALSLCFLTQASAKADTEAALSAIYAARDAAFKAKDVAGTLAPYSPNVILYDAQGAESEGVAAQKADLAKLFASGITLSPPDTQLDEFVAGKTGREATVKATRHVTVTSKVLVLGAVQLLVVEEAVRDHWVEGKNGWHITQERRLTPSSLLELCFTAAAGPPKARIVGKWAGYVPAPSGTQALMTMRFRENGTESETEVSPRLKTSVDATYTTTDDVLTKTLVRGIQNGQVMPNLSQVEIYHFRFEGDTLILTLADSSSEMRFTRQPE